MDVGLGATCCFCARGSSFLFCAAAAGDEELVVVMACEAVLRDFAHRGGETDVVTIVSGIEGYLHGICAVSCALSRTICSH